MRWVYRISALGVFPFGLHAIQDDFHRFWLGSEGALDLTGLGTLVGFAIILPGLMNLLNDQYGRGAFGLRVTTFVVNLFMLLVFTRLEMISRGPGMFMLLPALFLVMSAYSAVLVAQVGEKKTDPSSAPQAMGLGAGDSPGAVGGQPE